MPFPVPQNVVDLRTTALILAGAATATLAIKELLTRRWTKSALISAPWHEPRADPPKAVLSTPAAEASPSEKPR